MDDKLLNNELMYVLTYKYAYGIAISEVITVMAAPEAAGKRALLTNR